MTSVYPISWPRGIPRTEPSRRGSSQFKTTLDAAMKNVHNSLRRFGEATGKPVKEIVLSTNYALGDRNPADPGVAAWFLWDGAERCIAIDRYPKIEHNLQAIYHILEARVTEARHGGLRIVQQTFTGFIALPSPTMVVLGIPVFKGEPPYQIIARLRYRKDADKIIFWYEMWRTDIVFDHAFNEAIAKVRDEAAIKVLIGHPEA